MRWPDSLRARLTLWYTLVLGLPLVAFAGASVFVLDRALTHRAGTFLAEALGAFTAELTSEQQEEPTAARAIGSSLHDVQFRDVRLAVFDTLGRLVATGTVDSTARFAMSRPGDIAHLGVEVHDRAGGGRSIFTVTRSEERRVGKEGRSRLTRHH